MAELNARQLISDSDSVQEVNGDHMIVSVGPHHPSTHGVLRLVLELDGETIVKCTPEVGFLHTGIEKTAEYLNWQQANTVTDRMDYLSPISNNLGYCLAVEKLLHLEVPARAAAVRVILAELQRIASHMAWLGTHGLDLGAQSIFFYCFDLREVVLDILEHVAGQRMNPSYFRIGGLAQDVPDNFTALVHDFLAKYPQRAKELRALLDKNPIWLDRTRRVGRITPEQAVALGVTGPNLRATGVDYDVRKAYPYSGYEKYQFNVPLGEHGDVYDRYIVRMQEMDESAQIIRQAIDAFPEGDWQVQDRKIVRPPKAEVRQNMEALIHHFKLVSQGFTVPAGEVYQALESPRGEIGFYIVSEGGTRPWRMRVRPPSFYNTFALPTVIEGGLVADMVAGIASMDPIFGEVDR